MYCVNCGKEFEGKFCPECGTPAGGGNTTHTIEVVNNQGQGLREERFDAIKDLGKIYTEIDRNIDEAMYLSVCKDKYLRELETAQHVGKDGLVTGAAKTMGKATLAISTLGVSALVNGYSKKKKAAEKETQLMGLQHEIGKIEGQIQQCCESVKSLLASQEYKNAIMIIPEEYQDFEAATYISRMINTGRVDTWKEAVNTYMNEILQTRILETNIAQLDALQQGVEVAKELADLANQSVIFQKEQLELTGEMVEGLRKQNSLLDKQIEEMIKIRKATKKSAKSAKISAFCNVIELLS